MTGFFYRRQREHTADLFSHVGFRPAGVPDVFGGGDIKYKKDGLFFFFPECFDESSVTLGRYIPVDCADIIAVLVGANIVKFKTGSLEYGTEIALHVAIDSLAYLDFVPP